MAQSVSFHRHLKDRVREVVVDTISGLKVDIRSPACWTVLRVSIMRLQISMSFIDCMELFAVIT
jgi:hypothetical protein